MKKDKADKKKTYTSPKLKSYGAIERHTGSGTGTMKESVMNQSTMRFP